MDVTPAYMLNSKPKVFEKSLHRRALRLLRMISILHGKGFQGLRIFPMHTGAGAYRFYVFPATYADETGLFYKQKMPSNLMAGHSNSDHETYFGFDGTGLSAHEIALKFIEEFPVLIDQANMVDYAYAGWFMTMLAHCEYGFLPMVHESSGFSPSEIPMIAIDGDERLSFPLPPHPAAAHEPEPRTPPALQGNQKAIAYYSVLKDFLGGRFESISEEKLVNEAIYVDAIVERKVKKNLIHPKYAEAELIKAILPHYYNMLGGLADALALIDNIIEVTREQDELSCL